MAQRQINQRVGFLLFSMLMLLTLLPPAHVVSMACNACGPECANACGTAMFRACCFNYNKKRSAPAPDFEHITSDAAANLSEGFDSDPIFTEDLGHSSVRQKNPKLPNSMMSSRWLQLVGRVSDGTWGSDKKQHYLGYNFY